jgi:hypothetical protein
MLSKVVRPPQRGQSVILVAFAFVALILFVAIAVDMSSAYFHRRTAQNAADAAALAGAQELGRQINKINPESDGAIKGEMNEYAQRNAIPDTDPLDTQANANVEGYYLDAHDKRLPGVPAIGDSPDDSVPDNALGIEAIAYITAPTFLGGIMGFGGYPLQAQAAAELKTACSGGDCLLPIAIHSMGFLSPTGIITKNVTLEVGQCYNIWDGPGAANMGWLNWSYQGASCHDRIPGEDGPDDCSAACLSLNMDPEFCPDGTFVEVGDWVGGAPGVANANQVRAWMDRYIGRDSAPYEYIPARIPIYDVVKYQGDDEEHGASCGKIREGEETGFAYQVVGFAAIRITGYRLSKGGGKAVEYDITCGEVNDAPLGCAGDELLAPPYAPPEEGGCLDYPECWVCEGGGTDCPGEPMIKCDWLETGDVNRITAIVILYTDTGGGQNCKAVGNLLAPSLSR